MLVIDIEARTANCRMTKIIIIMIISDVFRFFVPHEDNYHAFLPRSAAFYPYSIHCVFVCHWRPISRSWARFIERPALAANTLIVLYMDHVVEFIVKYQVPGTWYLEVTLHIIYATHVQ